MGGLWHRNLSVSRKRWDDGAHNRLPGFPEKDGWLAKQKELSFDFIAAGVMFSDYDSCAAMVAKIEAEVGPIDGS